MTMNKLASYWDFFDKVYCISLKEREDRRREALIQFENVGLAGKVEFYLTDKHATDAEAGIYRSHVTCLKIGLQAGAERIAIFEDDIRFERFYPEKLKDCIHFLHSDISWNMFFFGCLISGRTKTPNKSVHKIKYRCMAHAYVINRGFAERVAATPWRNIAYDDMLRSIQQDFYAAYPSFAYQGDLATDNDKAPRLNKFRRFIGGLRRIQMRNEFYQNHKTAIIAVHILVILVTAMWIL